MSVNSSLRSSLIAISNNAIGSYASAEQVNPTNRGIAVVVDITAISGGTTLTVTIRGRDKVSGKTWNLLVSASLTTTGTTVLKVFPGATAAANTVANDMLPEHWDVLAAVGTSNSITATIGGCKLI